tara:strand:- start:6226 stop:7221 length:996 start_codon:yes stop_codon:yes gene_type:complete
MLKKELWVNKYAPKVLDDIVYQDNVINLLKKTYTSKNFPHLIFHGPPGTGKTSTIIALSKEIYGEENYKKYILELNASDERGINIIREKIKYFSKITNKISVDETINFKLVILDEADSITTSAQSALRRTIESFSNLTRFCIICNYINKIIDPILSRCSVFRFILIPNNIIKIKLKSILETEHISLKDNIIEYLINECGGDLRYSINLLQCLISFNQNSDDNEYIKNIDYLVGKIDIEEINKVCNFFTDSSLTHFDIIKKVDLFLLKGFNIYQFLEQLIQKIIKDDKIQEEKKIKIIENISETDLKLIDGSNIRIQIIKLIMSIYFIYKNK